MELDPPDISIHAAIVRLRVHRHCDFNQLSDRSIITLLMLIHDVKEETLMVIFLLSFLKSDAQKSSNWSNAPHNRVAGNSPVDLFSTLKALNKLYRFFLLLLSYWE